MIQKAIKFENKEKLIIIQGNIIKVNVQMKRNESQISSKAMSTTPSIRQVSPQKVHSHHKYQSLLHFFTSFMTDFKFYIVELKELVYQVVGVHPKNLHLNRKSSFDLQCQHCQVQFLMKSCRNTRQDLVRILAILRGCSTFKQSCFDQVTCQSYQQISSKLQTVNSSKLQHFDRLIKSPSKSQENASSFNMGMLTFREMTNERQSEPINKNWSSRFGIIEQNLEVSASQSNISFMFDKQSEQKIEIRKEKDIGQACGECSDEFKKAYLLIKLIKEQISSTNEYGNESTRNKNETRAVVSETFLGDKKAMAVN